MELVAKKLVIIMLSLSFLIAGLFLIDSLGAAVSLKLQNIQGSSIIVFFIVGLLAFGLIGQVMLNMVKRN